MSGSVQKEMQERTARMEVVTQRLGHDLQNILRQSYDYLTIMSTQRRSSNLQNILRRKRNFFRHDSLAVS